MTHPLDTSMNLVELTDVALVGKPQLGINKVNTPQPLYTIRNNNSLNSFRPIRTK